MPITRQLAQLYAGNTVVPGVFEPFRIWGLCSRMVDVARVDSGAQARAVHGLAQAAQFPEGDGLFVVWFPASWPGRFRASFGGQSTEGAARLSSTLVLPAPFLGTGYTKHATAAVPEFWLDLTQLPIGAELWHLAEDGGAGYEAALAAYAGRHAGWRSFPAAQERGLHPGGAGHAPAGSINRGLLVSYQGAVHPADFGPEEGMVTAYRTAQDGSVAARRLTAPQCEDLSYFRLLCTWREAPFEILALDELTATIALTSGNAEQAARLGLAEAGRHAWRAQVPTAELADVIEQTRTIGVQPRFGS